MLTMSRELIHELQQYIRLSDPASPINWQTEEALYEPLDQGVRGSDFMSCIDELARTILLRGDTEGPTCQLFTGFPGTGKTTELRRLKGLLEANSHVPTYVLFVDFEEFISIYDPISITDVLRVLAYSLDRAATIETAIQDGNLNPDNVKIGYLERLFDFVSEVDVQIKELGFETYGLQLMAEIKNNPNFRQRVNDALNLRFQVFAKEAKEMMVKALSRLQKATNTKRVIVIADGLEKLTYMPDEAREKAETAAETTFVTHADLLRLPVHVVYTFPFWLRFRAPQLGGLYDGEPRVLPMVKIFHRDGRPATEGREKLVALVNRRMPVERVFGKNHQETLGIIIEASGGFFKDLLRFIRDALVATPQLPIPPAVCARVLERASHAVARAIRTPEAKLLAEIAQTRQLPKGDRTKVAAFSRLFIYHLVLTYLNGDEWYDVHPLVRRVPEVREYMGTPNG